MSWPTIDPAAVHWDAAGLVPVVVQDALDRRVLMLAYADVEALAATVATGEVHFHSRSRDRLWKKGETSGNILRLVELAIDCDGDALLLTAEPAGPTCHRGTPSCFDPDGTPAARGEGFAWLEALWTTIASRAQTRPPGSYTGRLLDGGVDAVGRKVVEEATEVLMAAKDDAALEAAGAAADSSRRAGARDALTGEVADLLFHTLVLLAERGLAPSAVLARLRERHQP